MKPTNTIAGMVRELQARGVRFKMQSGGVRTEEVPCRCPLEALTGKSFGDALRDANMAMWRLEKLTEGADGWHFPDNGPAQPPNRRARALLLRLVKP